MKAASWEVEAVRLRAGPRRRGAKPGRRSGWGFALCTGILAFGAATELEAQTEPVALRGGTVITVSGEVIPNGTLLMHQGRITAVGASVSLPADTRVITVIRLNSFIIALKQKTAP